MFSLVLSFVPKALGFAACYHRDARKDILLSTEGTKESKRILETQGRLLLLKQIRMGTSINPGFV